VDQLTRVALRTLKPSRCRCRRIARSRRIARAAIVNDLPGVLAQIRRAEA
jgi:hypothetical protein